MILTHRNQRGGLGRINRGVASSKMSRGDTLREEWVPLAPGEVSGKTPPLEGIFPFPSMKGHFSVYNTGPEHLFSKKVLRTPKHRVGKQRGPSRGSLHRLVLALPVCDLGRATQPWWTWLSYLPITSFPTPPSVVWY